jgi:hypothetical protein
MSVLSTSTFEPSRTNGFSSLFRKFEIAESTVAGVNIGRTAVKSEVKLGIFIFQDTPQPEQANDYLGEIEINHTATSVPQDLGEISSIDDTKEVLAPDDDKANTVSHSYIATEPIKPTKNNPYPEHPALLAPN